MNWATVGVLFSLIGCSGAGNSDSEDPRGSLAVALSAVDSQGDVYRLRNAEFSIDGYSYATGEYIPTNVVVSSETDIDAPVISTRVLEGTYNVTFLGGSWYMERLTATGGAEPVEQAVFIGPNNQYAYVYEKSTTAVSFRFGVDGELIDFIGGDLQIGITVEHPGESQGGFGGTGAVGGFFPAGAPGMGAFGGRG